MSLYDVPDNRNLNRPFAHPGDIIGVIEIVIDFILKGEGSRGLEELIVKITKDNADQCSDYKNRTSVSN